MTAHTELVAAAVIAVKEIQELWDFADESGCNPVAMRRWSEHLSTLETLVATLAGPGAAVNRIGGEMAKKKRATK